MEIFSKRAKKTFNLNFIKMKKLVLRMVFILALVSCSHESFQNSATSEFIFEKSKILLNYKMTDEDIKALQKLGFSGRSSIVMERTDYVDNLTYIYYLMDGDIEVRKNSIKSMLKELLDFSIENKSNQFRTSNLVNSPRNIHIIGMNIYNNTLREGLIRAVENYNDLNINLSFSLEFRIVKTISQAISAANDSDILAKQLGDSPGGSSGFPSGGNPYQSLYVSESTASFGIDVCEHVFTHEIGHTIGLRHSDYFDRSFSCGIGGNEGDAGVGAIHIPGTPLTTDIDIYSIMLSCFNSNDNGEFSNFDIIALESIY